MDDKGMDGKGFEMLAAAGSGDLEALAQSIREGAMWTRAAKEMFQPRCRRRCMDIRNA